MGRPWLETWRFGEEHERKVDIDTSDRKHVATVRQHYGILPPDDGGPGRSRAVLVKAAPALVRALLAVEWSANARSSCPTCDACVADQRHEPDCGLDVALTDAGLPDQASRDEARAEIAKLP